MKWKEKCWHNWNMYETKNVNKYQIRTTFYSQKIDIIVTVAVTVAVTIAVAVTITIAVVTVRFRITAILWGIWVTFWKENNSSLFSHVQSVSSISYEPSSSMSNSTATKYKKKKETISMPNLMTNFTNCRQLDAFSKWEWFSRLVKQGKSK